MKFIRLLDAREALTHYPTAFARAELHEVEVEELRDLLDAARLLQPYPPGDLFLPALASFIETRGAFPKPIVLMAIPPHGPPPYAPHILLDGRHRSTAAVRLHAEGRLRPASRLLAMVGR